MLMIVFSIPYIAESPESNLIADIVDMVSN